MVSCVASATSYSVSRMKRPGFQPCSRRRAGSASSGAFPHSAPSRVSVRSSGPRACGGNGGCAGGGTRGLGGPA